MKAVYKILILIALTFTISCSNDEDNKTSDSTQNFLSEYLSTTGFNQETVPTIDGEVIRYGVFFTPLVTGKITALKVKLPESNGALEISIWDAGTATAIRTETVDLNAANATQTFDIADLNLTKFKQYAITVKSGSYYDRSRTDDASAVYPLIIGDIQIDAFITGSGNSTAFNFFAFDDFYLGDVSFVFEKTE